MLHSVKLALSSSRSDKAFLSADQRLREADDTITQLQRWFPQLQVAVEDNEKTWETVGYTVRKVSTVAQQTFPTEHPLQYMLDHLHAAGVEITTPTRSHELYEQRARAAANLRAFNDRIRELRNLQMGCVAALKEKEYYNAKVETLRVNEGRKKKVTERDVDKRLRNEQKLAEVANEVNFKWQRLQKELAEVESEKERIVEDVLWMFVKTQGYFFGLNPIGVAASLLESRRGAKEGVDVYEESGLTSSLSPVSGRAEMCEVISDEKGG